jgi:hypothetical protein
MSADYEGITKAGLNHDVTKSTTYEGAIEQEDTKVTEETEITKTFV